MIVEIKIPAAGESVTEAAIGNWLIEDGSWVEKDQEIAEVETDKATLPLIAPETGKIKINAEQGKKIKVGDIACTIDTESSPPSGHAKDAKEKKTITTTPSAAAATSEEHRPQAKESFEMEQKPIAEPPKQETVSKKEPPVRITPLAQSIMDQNDLDVDAIINGLRKINRHDVEQVIHEKLDEPDKTPKDTTENAGEGEVLRTPLSPLRRKLSKRLVAVKNETAMLTTFNEVDMSAVLEIRRKYQQKFQEKYGLRLGIVSFFTMACTKALHQFPNVNSFIDKEDILTPGYTDIGIAVQTDKGLMVPVIRKTNNMNLAQIETAISELAAKARASRLSIEEMTGGTFTITNGGVFGSMLSTPILNPPQSAILGMHNIVDRPVAINGKVEIRPVMYVALSYDHRVIDGKDSVGFLYKVKELIESPVNILMEGRDPMKMLLGL